MSYSFLIYNDIFSCQKFYQKIKNNLKNIQTKLFGSGSNIGNSFPMCEIKPWQLQRKMKKQTKQTARMLTLKSDAPFHDLKLPSSYGRFI